MTDETKHQTKMKRTLKQNKTTTPILVSGWQYPCTTKRKKKKMKHFIKLKRHKQKDAHKLAPMANFGKIYENTEGFHVMDGSEHGGIFTRSACVCGTFKKNKYVSNRKITGIIFKIQEHIKKRFNIYLILHKWLKMREHYLQVNILIVYFLIHYYCLIIIDEENDDLDPHYQDDDSQEKFYHYN